MDSLTIVQQGAQGDLFTTSEAIAEGAGVEHRAVLQTIAKYQDDFEGFGPVAFEMRKGSPLAHGGFAKATRIAKLNEQQATLLLTYAKNTEQVRAFKVALVKEFDRMAKALAAPRELTLEEMTLQVIEGQKARIAELEPKAEFADTFLSANGDYDTRDAAQILKRDHGIVDIGQNRLRDWMQEHNWLDAKRRPYQHKIDADYLRLKPSSFKFKRTNGEEQLADPQVRVTPRGVEALARALKKELVA